MKYFTKEWYKNGCVKNEEIFNYYKYCASHNAAFPKFWNKISFHDAKIINVISADKILTIELLLSDNFKTVFLKFKDPQIIKNCELHDKICIAEELYIKNGYAFHLLLSDNNNELYEFTMFCSNIELAEPDALSVFTLAAYSIPGSPFYYDESCYDSNAKQIVHIENGKPICDASLLPLPKLEDRDLLFQYLKQLNSNKINAYLDLFANDLSSRMDGELEICFNTNCERIPIKDTDGFHAYCIQKLLPILIKWENKYGIKINTQYPQLQEMECTAFADEEIYVPTDGLRIRQSKYLCLEKENCFDRRTYLCKSREKNADLKNAVDFPFVDEEKIKQAFLSSHNLEKSASDSLQSEQYIMFRDKYLDEILIQWCKKNKIKYQP
ncbi:unknown [Clostridium sp. CAG:678]|nr:unknown [Clostridium sp. CAG:678]